MGAESGGFARLAPAARKCPRRGALALAGVAVLALSPFRLSAQENPVDVPEDIVQTIDPEGIDLGSFVVFPRLNADVRHDTNIYNRPSGPSDTVFQLRPGVRIVQDLDRHSLAFDLAAEGRRYVDTPAENSEQWSARADGRLDLANRFVLSGTAGIADRIERRGTLGDAFFTDRPVSYRDTNVGAAFGRMGGILEWQVDGAVRWVDYDDGSTGGVPIDQSFRDVRRDTVRFRADYRRFSRLGFFGRVSGTQLSYSQGSQRDSKGFSVLGGLTYRVTDLVNVEAAAGFVHQNPEDPAAVAINAIDFSLSADWTPSPRARLQFDAARSVERAPFATIATVLVTQAEARGTYALGDRTLVGVQAGLERDRYQGIDRRDTRYYAEATARYLVTPKLAAVAAVGARKQTTAGTGGRNYEGATVRAGIILAF